MRLHKNLLLIERSHLHSIATQERLLKQKSYQHNDTHQVKKNTMHYLKSISLGVKSCAHKTISYFSHYLFSGKDNTSPSMTTWAKTRCHSLSQDEMRQSIEERAAISKSDLYGEQYRRSTEEKEHSLNTFSSQIASQDLSGE